MQNQYFKDPIKIESAQVALQILKKLQKNAAKLDIECQFVCNSQSDYDQIKKIIDDIERFQSRQTTPYVDEGSDSINEESESDEEIDSLSTQTNEGDEYNEEQLQMQSKADPTINQTKSSLNESLIFQSIEPIEREYKNQSYITYVNVKSYYDALVLNSYFANHEDKRFQIQKPKEKIEQVHKLQIEVKNNFQNDTQKILDHIKIIQENLYQYLFYLPRDQYLQLRHSRRLQQDLYDKFQVNFAFDVNFRISSNPDNAQFYYIIYGLQNSKFMEAFYFILQSQLVKIYTLDLTTNIHTKTYSDQKYRKLLASMRLEVFKNKEEVRQKIYEINQLEFEQIKHKQGFTMNYNKDFYQDYKNLRDYFSKKIFWCVISQQQIIGQLKINHLFQQKVGDEYIASFLTNVKDLDLLIDIIKDNKNNIKEVVIQQKSIQMDRIDNFKKIDFTKYFNVIQKEIELIKQNFDGQEAFQKKFQKQFKKIENQIKERQLNYESYKNGKGRYLQLTKKQDPIIKQKNNDKIPKIPSQNKLQKQNSQQVFQQNKQQQFQNKNAEQVALLTQKLNKQQSEKHQQKEQKLQLLPETNKFLHERQNYQPDFNQQQQEQRQYQLETLQLKIQQQTILSNFQQIQQNDTQDTSGIDSQIISDGKGSQNNFLQNNRKQQNNQQNDFEEEKNNQRGVLQKQPNQYNKEQSPFLQQRVILDKKIYQKQSIQTYDEGNNLIKRQNNITNQSNDRPTTNQIGNYYNNSARNEQKDTSVNIQTYQQDRIQQQQVDNHIKQMDNESQKKIKEQFQQNKREIQTQNLNDEEIKQFLKKLLPQIKIYEYNQQQNLPYNSQTKLYHSVFKNQEFKMKDIKESCTEELIYIFRISQDFLVKKGDNFYLRDNFKGYPILYIVNKL
ncbi:hypothetical protein ABPG74_015667 [Tetrahymena malaccensis]